MLRDAIAQMPMNPNNEVAFGNTGPGLTQGKQTQAPGSAAPAFPKTPPPQNKGQGGQQPPPPPKG